MMAENCEFLERTNIKQNPSRTCAENLTGTPGLNPNILGKRLDCVSSVN